MTKKELIDILTTQFSGFSDDTPIAMAGQDSEVFDIQSVDYRSESPEEGYLLLIKES